MSKIQMMLMVSLLIQSLGCSVIRPSTDPFYRVVLENNTGHELALFSQAEAFRQQGQFKQARKYYLRCLRKSPETIPAWIGLGASELELSRFPQAEIAFQKALGLQEFEEARLGLATALLLQGKSNQARQENQISKERFGESAAWNRLEGDIDFFENHPQQALDAYRKSLLLFPRQPKIEQRVRELEEFLTSTP